MQSTTTPATVASEDAPATRWEAIKRRFEWALEKRWPVVAFQSANAVYMFFWGNAYANGTDAAYLILAGVVYFVVFVFGQYLIIETPKQLKERLEKGAAKARATLTMEMDTFFTAEDFLMSRVRKMIEVLSVLQLGQKNALQITTEQSLSKEELLNSVLRDLCAALTAISAKTLQLPLQQAQFRATFMEVGPCVQVGVDDAGRPKYRPISLIASPATKQAEDRLVYVGWHTWDGSIPRSMKEGVTMGKGERCAGLAWQRGRVVIEDDFKDGHEWINNYTGQNLKYKSMISVPVRRGYSHDPEGIVGVITVDTQLPRYFGEKDDEQQEKRWSAMAQPYGTYIAFLCALDSAVGKLREALAKQDVSGGTALLPPNLGAAAPDAARALPSS